MDKTDEAIRVLITDPVLQKRLAKYLVHRCFRNSVLEDLHAGIAPDSKAGDYSDVLVSTPFGEIPWPKLSRFDDEEMSTLMIDVVQKTYEFIQELFDEENGGGLLLQLAARDSLPRWEDPRYDSKRRAASNKPRDLFSAQQMVANAHSHNPTGPVTNAEAKSPCDGVDAPFRNCLDSHPCLT